MVELEPADFWQLRARMRDTELATAQATQKIAAARHRQNACFETLAKKYQLDPSVNYRWDDTTLTLTPIEESVKDE